MVKKVISLCFAVFVFVASWCLSPAGAEAAMPKIQADQQYFDVERGLYVLRDNVVIEHKNRRVTAGEARTNLVEVWARGGITFFQDDIRMSGNSVYANFPKHSVQVSGGVDFSRDDLRIHADAVEFNWKTKLAVFNGNVIVHQGGTASSYDTITYNILSDTLQ